MEIAKLALKGNNITTKVEDAKIFALKIVILMNFTKSVTVLMDTMLLMVAARNVPKAMNTIINQDLAKIVAKFIRLNVIVRMAID